MPVLNVSRAAKVWADRGNTHELSASAFNLIVTVTTCYGLTVFAIASAVTYRMSLRSVLNGWILLGFLAGAFAGCIASSLADPLLSCVGLTMMAGSLGGISGPVFGQYHSTSMMEIASATVVATLCFGAAGVVYPRSLENWGGLLCTGLFGMLAVQLTGMLLPRGSAPHEALRLAIDWSGLALFSAYILYDFNRARYVNRNTRNAVKIGVSVFLDMINVFVELLDLLGKSRADGDGEA